MSQPDPEAVRAIRSWYRLQRALDDFGRSVQQEHGVTGQQLAMLRIVGEREEWELAELRERLAMHPATLGQALDRLAARGFVSLSRSSQDRRRRRLAVTDRGREVLASVPLAGPVRLRSVPEDPDRLRRLSAALDDAVELFGLGEWAS